jgi:RNA-binding protein YlmH
MLTIILATYCEKYCILYDSQEGFKTERCTSSQFQLITRALKDAKFSTQDIYLLNIEFKNAFESIDHARLLTIISNLGTLKMQ